MTTAVPENNVQAEVANEWFISDDVLVSYLDSENSYNVTATEKELKWFNFDIPVPQETPQEAKEREEATMQQVRLGILRVVNQPPTNQRPQPQQMMVQPPQPALAPEVAQSMGCMITPAFISKLNDRDVSFDEMPQQNVQQPEIIQPKKDDIVDSFINKATVKQEKYKFSLTGKNKIGKNDPCPCGSGHKFKKCHGR